MSILLQLSSLALRGAAHATAEFTGVNAAGAAGDVVVGFLTQRFSDHSKGLTRALDRASDRAWRAVEVALAGRSWWDRCALALRTAEERAFREQVLTFLQHNPLDGVDGFGPDFRKQCLAQLQAARKAGLFSQQPPSPDQLAQQVGSLARFGDPTAVVENQFQVVAAVGGHLRKHGYDALATFLELRPASGPPVLAAAMRYFFEREVQRDRELFQGLAYDRLEGLAQEQTAGFGALAEALDAQTERLESLLHDVQAVVVQTHRDVLDVKAEMQRQGQQMQELSAAVLRALEQHQLDRRALQAGDSLSVRNEEERRLVKELVRRYRAAPAEERRTLPALLNAVGKLEVMTGEFESAERDFRELAALAPNKAVRAEAAHQAYLAALERRAWPDALAALQEAIQIDPARFALFPSEKFEAERILGAGGFGVAFLCRNTRSGGRVVVKTVRREAVERDLNEVFREAQALEELEHPAIIRVRDCDFADPGRSRPYLVMDYFPGQTLAEYVRQTGPLSPGRAVPLLRLVAEGLARAHHRGILHRDIKPDNLLVRTSPDRGWEVKLIDFGLALRAQSERSTLQSSLNRTVTGASIAGTIEYAAPEQMGKLPGVPVGPYSDVYAFGKTACFAVFGTSQPTFQHWQQLPAELADLLGRCLNEQPIARPASFTRVLNDLDRLGEHRQPAAPATPTPRVMDAEPVADVLPVEPEETLPRRRETPRRPPRTEERRQPAPRTRASSGGINLIVLLLIILTPVAAGAIVIFASLFRLWPQSTPGPGSVPQPVGFDLPRLPQQTARRPRNRDSVAAPLGQAELQKVVAELQKKPSLDRLRELAPRLAATSPTTEQKQRHDKVDLMRGLSGGPNPAALAEAEKSDDVLQISRALNGLLPPASTDREDHKDAALALQKWGASDNVDALTRALADGNEFGVWDLRINLCKALAAIGDPRGVKPVAARMRDLHDWTRGLPQILISFGGKAEPEMIEQLNSSDPFTPARACEILKAVGTSKSLPALRAAEKNFHARRKAQEAIQAIEAREKGG